ncbi:MAG: MotA/TolQ/ExbB proton channel family protein [Deltaproteobacteria bacterium]|nr:MAG: MotA/TolQ/ExbB proton channel family protein [Deltaproteobacteria bacterium]
MSVTCAGAAALFVVAAMMPGASVPALAGAQATAEQRAPQTLDELLEQVRRGWRAERRENAEREARFRRERDRQKALLEEARRTLAAEEARSQRLEKQFEENEGRIAQLENTLKERLGTLGEAFGVVRQVAGDTRGHVRASVISAQFPGRDEFLGKLAESKALPSIEELRKLWWTLLEEMTESGKVVRFEAPVIRPEGKEERRQAVRIGSFNVISGGKYLEWDGDVQKLAELARQPGSRKLAAAAAFEKATSGLNPFWLDPSRGQILSLLVQTPSTRERIDQGGPIGMAIIVLGVLAGLLGLARLVIVWWTDRKVRRQQSREEPSEDNPLGRVLMVYRENQDADAETLELKLDEAILRETARMEKLLWVVKAVSVVAPLMGLLGTVTGMIRTFQMIMLYGTGDPRLMAGGISEALVTTMLGLFVAIPLVLLHAFISSGSKRIIDVVEEQSAGMIAEQAERRHAVA